MHQPNAVDLVCRQRSPCSLHCVTETAWIKRRLIHPRKVVRWTSGRHEYGIHQVFGAAAHYLAARRHPSRAIATTCGQANHTHADSLYQSFTFSHARDSARLQPWSIHCLYNMTRNWDSAADTSFARSSRWANQGRRGRTDSTAAPLQLSPQGHAL